MAGPSDGMNSAAARQSAIERMRDTFNRPAANANDGYFKTPDRTPPPPPPFEPPKPQKISENSYTRQQRWDRGFTAGRALNDNPGFRNPNPISATRLGMPPMQGVRMPLRMPRISGGGLAGAGLSAIPILIDAIRDPKSLTRNSYEEQTREISRTISSYPPIPPGFIYDPDKGTASPNPLDPRLWDPDNPFNPFNSRKFSPVDVGKPDPDRNAPTNQGIPDWLDTLKNRDLIPQTSGSPNAESKKWFPNATRIKIWSTNNRQYIIYGMLSYNITAIPKYNQGTPEKPIMSARNANFRYLREGTDDYVIQFSFWTYADSFTTFKVKTGSFTCEPWTLENLGLDPAIKNPNPDQPENLVPETNQPFFPPLPNYLDELARGQPPTILDPNDFKPPASKKPLSPMFPPELAPIPKPLDPLQKPEAPIVPGTQPPKRSDEEERTVPPLFPFNPLPAPPNPIQNPPKFEPGTQNPNQPTNDRGIFPARKADITPTISGSPLSPDVEIGGDPVRLVPPAPKITKPKLPGDPETPEEKKKREDEEKKLFPPFLPIPPIFPRPAGPTGKIDPKTADDITKSKNPPVPPVGTKPKCQDSCMAGLETGQQAILDKMGSGLNVGLNAAELALLTTINNKVGDQVPGGLSGKLTRLSSWLHLDRALNLMIYANTLHNAYMLSSGISQTLFSAISNVLNFVGIKDAENNPLDIGSILGKTADAYAKSVLGVTTVDGIKAEWKKYSRIYAAAANVLWSVQSIGQSILSVLEIVGSNVAKIGNALIKFGAIGEKAFGRMNDTPNYQNKFFTGLEKVENAVSHIDSIASEGLSARDQFEQLGQQNNELIKSVQQDEGSKQGKESPEAAALKAAELAKKAASQPPTIPPTAERKPEV